MCQSKAQGGRRCAARIARDQAAAAGKVVHEAKPGYAVPRPQKEGDPHLPPAVAPTPDRTFTECLLEIVIEYWHTHHGQVTDPTGIPEAEISRDKTAKENIGNELKVEALSRFGPGTRVTGVYDENRNTVVIHLVGPDGVPHVGVGTAARDSWGCVTHKDTVWDPPTAPVSTAPDPSWKALMQTR